MKRIINWLLIALGGVTAIVVAIANRQVVSLRFDPFSPETPFLAIDVPVFALIFAGVFVGILIGGLASWLSGGKSRRAARRYRRQARKLEKELDETRAGLPEPAEREERDGETGSAPGSGAPLPVVRS